MRILTTVAFCAVVAGCAAPRPAVDMPKFIPEQHDPYNVAGNSTVTGQGFMRQKGGSVVTCAGTQVLMVPATPFFQEFIGHLRAGRRVNMSDKVEGNYRSILKLSQCDAQGNFAFSGIPSGRWMIGTEVTWSAGRYPQGGMLLREISVSSGQTQQVLLSDSDYIGR